MRIRFLRRTALALFTLLVVGLCFADTSAQGTRTKRSRRVTNPVRTSSTAPVTQPTPPPVTTNTEAQIISTADDPAMDDTQDEPPVSTRRTSRSSRNAPAADTDPERMQRTVIRLSKQVDKLTDKLEQIEGQQRALVDLERLSRAEQRAEAFRAQLREVQAKEAELQARSEQIEFEIKPENIERSIGTYGTTRPDEVREMRRRQLESERTRIQSQLNLIATSRTRLESAIALADTEVERLRARLDDSDPLTKPRTGDYILDNVEPTNPSDTATTPARTTPYPSPSGTP